MLNLPEIENLQNGTYRINPKYGKRYSLTYKGKPIIAHYFGCLNGNHVFFRKNESLIFRYSCPVGIKFNPDESEVREFRIKCLSEVSFSGTLEAQYLEKIILRLRKKSFSTT